MTTLAPAIITSHGDYKPLPFRRPTWTHFIPMRDSSCHEPYDFSALNLFINFHGLQTSFMRQKAFKMWTRLSSQVSSLFILPFCTPFPQTQMYLPCQALLPSQVTDLPGTWCLPSSPLNYLLYFLILQDFSLPSGICLIPAGAGVLNGRK